MDHEPRKSAAVAMRVRHDAGGTIENRDGDWGAKKGGA